MIHGEPISAQVERKRLCDIVKSNYEKKESQFIILIGKVYYHKDAGRVTLAENATKLNSKEVNAVAKSIFKSKVIKL
jgi:hypothetical protein